jgi:hypothetical protein
MAATFEQRAPRHTPRALPRQRNRGDHRTAARLYRDAVLALEGTASIGIVDLFMPEALLSEDLTEANCRDFPKAAGAANGNDSHAERTRRTLGANAIEPDRRRL